MVHIRVFPIFVLDLAELSIFIYLHMDNGIDYPWIGEMLICIIHGAVHCSWIAIMQNSTIHAQCKRNLHYPWIVDFTENLSLV